MLIHPSARKNVVLTEKEDVRTKILYIKHLISVPPIVNYNFPK